MEGLDFDEIDVGETYEFVHARHGTFVAKVTATRWDDDGDEGIVNADLVSGVIKRRSGDVPMPCKLVLRWSRITLATAL